MDAQSSELEIKERFSGMPLSVYEAAKEGNTDALWGHRDHLHQILTPTGNTVLHIYIACATSSVPSSSPLIPNPDPLEERLNKAANNAVQKILKMCPQLLMQQNHRGETALHIAARHKLGSAGVVQVLIDAAKNQNSSDLEEGVSNPSWSQMLIRTTNNQKDTALHEAVRFHNVYVAEILTREDREFPYCANHAGETPLYLAAERGYEDMVLKILDTCSCPAYQGPNGKTALHTAVIYNDARIMRRLLTKMKKLHMTEVVDEQGWNPLHFAAFYGHILAVKKLLEYDKSAAYIGDNEGRTPLHIATTKGQLDVVKELIACCPDCCELVDHRGRNALHYATEKNQIQLIDCFVGEDRWISSVLINEKDADGNTPLHNLILSFYEGKLELFVSQKIIKLYRFVGDARVDKMAFNKENESAYDVILTRDSLSTLKKGLSKIFETNRVRQGHRASIVSKMEEDQKGVPYDNKELKDTHLVVATLISTVAFAAGFTMPGGYEGDKGPDQGFAVLTRSAAFKTYVITNTIAFTLSSSSVLMHLYFSRTNKQKKLFKWVGAFDQVYGLTTWALQAMVIAFITGTYAVLGHSSGLLATACVLGCCYFIWYFIYLKWFIRDMF